MASQDPATGPDDTAAARVREAFVDQAGWCERLGSPFTARLMLALAATLDGTTAVGRRILAWPGEIGAKGDIVPGRLGGGLHALVRAGRLPDLARLYPPHPSPDDATLAAAVAAALRDADAALLPWLDHAPQTNEVARSAATMLGLMAVAAETGLPLALYELGASAGLNLFADRFGYRYGAATAGDPAAALVLAPALEGPEPLVHPVQVVARRGVDLNPLAIADADDRARLFAFVWPDQAERLDRLARALAIASQAPPALDRADAADWIDALLAETPAEGVCRVVFHTIAWQYFPESTRARITAAMERAGAAATAATPLAWVSLEIEPDTGRCPIGLRLWPGGEPRTLALADPHVRAIRPA